MIILISGASHTGKTLLAQKLMEKFLYPSFSIDLLKMGLIRSKKTNLTPYDDEKIKEYLLPILKEIIKTAIENNQHLIIEGCYIPYNWKSDFSEEYLSQIKYICLIMTENYILEHFDDIRDHANVIEKRLYDECDMNILLKENKKALNECQKYNLDYVLFDEKYDIDNVKI